MEEAIPESVCG